MNINILNDDVQQFIKQHIDAEITAVVLKGSPFDAISTTEIVTQIQSKQKAKSKLPTWFTAKNIYYPPKIHIEQTSSEITAAYKSKLVSGKNLIDITGGFGIDTFYFSKQFEHVTYCEINEELAQIVSHNFKKLGIKNTNILATNGIHYLKNDVHFDCIFIDPSRRNTEKGKVFLLKDCTPYLPPKLDFLFTKTVTILVKLSPILDIKSALNDLKNTTEIHVVAVDNEVKELLFLLQKNAVQEPIIKTVNIKKRETEYFEFPFFEETSATFSEPLAYLFEPNAAILKAGGFTQISQQLGVSKLHPNSHLYSSNQLIKFPGRTFKINEIIPFEQKKSLKKMGIVKANITTRNFPKSVAQLRKELKIKDGGESYLFFTTNQQNKLIILSCEKI